MHLFVRQLVTEWRRLELPFENQTVIIAVSGGADSVSLLLAVHALKTRSKLRHRVVAAHFNHKLRGPESDGDEQFVRELTGRLGIELAVGSGNLPADGNIEQNARHSRYDYLRTTADNLDAFAVLTGHTVNDQAETVLMNLIRGSGPDGLSGMRPIRALAAEHLDLRSKDLQQPNTILVRPLLTWAKRVQTEAFCRDSGVEYRYDTMNEDTAFKRVRIRKILLPLLEDMNPRIVETLANTATLMQGVAGNDADIEPADANGALPLEKLRELDQPQISSTIRSWLRKCRGTSRQLELKHIHAIERLALSLKSGRTVELPGGKVVKGSGLLVYRENKVEN